MNLVLSDTPTLAEAEAVIERGLETFVEVGRALLAIRDGRLYRESHATFEDYCRERWDFSRSYAHRVIEASEVTEMLPMGNKPTSERQARALSPLRDEPAQMTEAWTEAVEKSNGKPTARIVQEAVAARQKPPLSPDEQREIDLAEGDQRDARRLIDLITGWVTLETLPTSSRRNRILAALTDDDRKRVEAIEAIYLKGTS